VVVKSNQRAKGKGQSAHFVFRQDHKGQVRSPKGTVPLPGGHTDAEHCGANLITIAVHRYNINDPYSALILHMR